MSKYTAEDYARAEFARHENRWLAARTDPEGTYPWNLGHAWASDAEMAASPGWSIVRDAESLTAREHLGSVWEKAHQVDVIPAGGGFIAKWDDGDFGTVLKGPRHEIPSRGSVFERRLLDPPPAPAWHRAQIIRATHVVDDSPSKWARTEAGDWVRLSAASGYTSAGADELRDVTVIAGAEQ